MSAIKVCLCTETFYPVVGGGETQARALAEGLAAKGMPVRVVTRRSDPEFEKVEEYGPVTVYRVGPAGGQHYKKWGLLFSTLPRLWRLRREFNLVYVSGFRLLGVPAVLVSKLLGKRCVLKADSTGEMSGEFFTAGLGKLGLSPRSVFFRPFLATRNWLLRRADAFVAISSPLEKELREHGVDPSKIHRIPNSVDTNRFRPVSPEEKRLLRQQLDLPQEATIVIYTGRLVSYKGLPLLLRVWREIQEAHSNAYLLLVGSGGLDIHNCEDELREYVSAHNLENSVRFTGAVHNVHEYLQAADIFVFPTEKEAFGISVIEAMACGLPIIGTNVGGLKGILEHRKNGLVISIGNEPKFRRAVETLLCDRTLLDQLTKAGLKWVRSRYSMDLVVQEYQVLFTNVLNI